jgi:hypothetical protein
MGDAERRELDEKLYSTVGLPHPSTPNRKGKEKKRKESTKILFPQKHALRAIFGVKAFWPS